MKPLINILCASLAATVAPSQTSTLRIILENESLRAEIVPDWAGRLMFFGHPTGPNALWTYPEAASFTVDANGKPEWKNVGGEKTWVGSQKLGWRAFAGITEGSVWPPPAWFDSMPMQVIHADSTSVLLRTGVHRGGDWEGAMEREFRLEGDVLVIRQRLLPTKASMEGPAGTPRPDDIRRLWSVAQIPRPDRVAMRTVGEGRHKENGNIPAPVPADAAGWVTFDIASMTSVSKAEADGDALAAPLRDGSGWLVIEQTAPERHLAVFETPGRAMVYASKPDFEPSAYVELEFAAYGPDAEQTLRFRIVDKPFETP